MYSIPSTEVECGKLLAGVCEGCTTKEFDLIITINSKEISKRIHEVLLEEQQIQRKASFFSTTYEPLTFFFLCQTISLKAFLTLIKSIELGDF
jgi:hypothetical protein